MKTFDVRVCRPWSRGFILRIGRSAFGTEGPLDNVLEWLIEKAGYRIQRRRQKVLRVRAWKRPKPFCSHVDLPPLLLEACEAPEAYKGSWYVASIQYYEVIRLIAREDGARILGKHVGLCRKSLERVVGFLPASIAAWVVKE